MTPHILILLLVIAALGCVCRWLRQDADELRDELVKLRERNERVEKAYSEMVLVYYEDSTDPRFERAPDWKPGDAGALAAFLKTDTGQVLQRRFAAVAAATAISGCADPMHVSHSAGAAHGWNEAYEWFVKLSRVTGEQVTKQDEQAPDDEERLLERFSS